MRKCERKVFCCSFVLPVLCMLCSHLCQRQEHSSTTPCCTWMTSGMSETRYFPDAENEPNRIQRSRSFFFLTCHRTAWQTVCWQHAGLIQPPDKGKLWWVSVWRPELGGRGRKCISSTICGVLCCTERVSAGLSLFVEFTLLSLLEHGRLTAGPVKSTLLHFISKASPPCSQQHTSLVFLMSFQVWRKRLTLTQS